MKAQRLRVPEGIQIKTAEDYQNFVNGTQAITKYKNEITEIDKIKFHSKKESKRYVELCLMKKTGMIKGFIMQKKFSLLPGIKGIAKEKYYKADFVVTYPDGRIEVEDTKGVRTPKFEYQRHLMYLIYEINLRVF